MIRYSRGRIIALIVIIIMIWCVFTMRTCSLKSDRFSITNNGNYVNIQTNGTLSIDIIQSGDTDRIQGRSEDGYFYPEEGSSRRKIRGEKVSITLPSSVTDVNIDTSVGDITITAFKGNSISLDTGIGDINGSNITALDVDASSGTGTIILDTVKAESINIDTGTGAISLLSADASDISADSAIGDIRITLTSPISEYALDINTGLGDWKAGTTSGTMGEYTTEDGSRSLSADTGIGNITVEEVK